MKFKYKLISWILVVNAGSPLIVSVQHDVGKWGLATRNEIRSRVARNWGFFEAPPPLILTSRSYTAENVDEMTARALIVDIARAEGVPPAIALAVATRESRFKPYAMSGRSAIGLMQVHISNQKLCGFANPAQMFEPVPNIKCGIKILKAALKSNPSRIDNALREYNGGSKCVLAKCAESEAYVQAIMPHILASALS